MTKSPDQAQLDKKSLLPLVSKLSPTGLVSI